MLHIDPFIEARLTAFFFFCVSVSNKTLDCQRLCYYLLLSCHYLLFQ